jgi:UDP-N-acetylmuramoyl-tripeptide--D-alanyl-D-alanine ligase
LAALAAASVWGIGAREAAAVLPRLAAGEMRGRLLRFAEGFAVINDSYNSNPVALTAMMNLLARTPGYGRRILAAGEMLELGNDSLRLHTETGRHAAAQKLDWVIGVQGAAEGLVKGAVEAGLPSDRVRFFASSTDAAPFVAGLLAPGDLLLVKGSRGVKMERIVEAVRARYALFGDGNPVPAGTPGRT